MRSLSFPASAFSLVAALCLFSLVSPLAVLADSSFTPIGDLNGAAFESKALDVSADGSIVVGYSIVIGATVAVTWDATNGLQPLGFLSGGPDYSIAYGISADGSVIAGTGSVGSGVTTVLDEAFVWDAVSGIQGLGYVGTSSADYSISQGISADGSTIVGSSSGEGTSTREGAAWDTTNGNSAVGLGDLGGANRTAKAHAASSDGTIIVGDSRSFASGILTEAFIWDATNGIQGLGDLPGGNFNSFAFGISGDGAIVVGGSRSGSGIEPFVWDAINGMQGLGAIPGGVFSSVAHAVSVDGAIIVGRGRTAAGDEAFIWDAENGMRSLQVVLTDLGIDLTNWQLREAMAVSADGQTVVGYGTNPSGFTEGFVAVIDPPVPAPVAGWQVILLLIVALFVVASFGLREDSNQSTDELAS